MIERLEVTPGPGTVIRYGSIAAWASPAASAGLISFLALSARNLAGSGTGGRQLADHLVSVLQARDPEPHVPFVVVGPSEEGWAGLLHGPVQVWDGARWIAPDPIPGWVRSPLWPSPTLAVTFAGAPAPPVSPDSLWDLEAGVVPGSGFVLVPAVRAPSPLGPAPWPTEGAAPDPGPGRLAAVAPAGTDEPAADAGPEEEPVAAAPPGPGPAAAGAEAVAAPGAGHPVGAVDLRPGRTAERVVAYPPLPSGSSPGRPVPGAPVVAGVVCGRGHLNRPGMTACVRCAVPISEQDVYNVSGTRPALGCLVLDDGAVYRLDRGYLVGADPSRDPTVRGGLARPLVLPGPQVSPTHAEIRLHDWDVVVTDRDSPGGTFVFGPDSSAWERLRPYEPRTLQPGTHMAFGQRVATFLTPWIVGAGPGTAPAGEPDAPASDPGDPPAGGGGQDVRSWYLGQ